MNKIKNIFIPLLLSSSISYLHANEELPVQKVEVNIPQEQIDNSVQHKEEQLDDVEKANIKDIYVKKIENPQFEMGIRYYTGSNGLKVNYDKAIYWFSNSSRDENNPKADMMIAAMYYQGQGFEQSKEKALNFYQRAGNRGSLDAQLILTGIYFFNQEFMNQELANYWIYKAIAQNSEIAESLKTAILLNQNDSKTMEKIIPLYENLANKKDNVALFLIGYFYFTGKFKEQSFDKAESYLALSAEQGNPIAIIMLDEIMKFSEIKK